MADKTIASELDRVLSSVKSEIESLFVIDGTTLKITAPTTVASITDTTLNINIGA